MIFTKINHIILLKHQPNLGYGTDMMLSSSLNEKI